VLTDPRAYIQGGSGNLPGDLLINLDHTIRGSGIIYADVDNRSIIRAENGLLTLYAFEGFRNETGVIQVAPNGALSVSAGFSENVPLGALDIEPGGVITSSTLTRARLVGGANWERNICFQNIARSKTAISNPSQRRCMGKSRIYDR
jgi:hypothetical protein